VLQRRTSGSGVVYYASKKLEAAGVRHAFSTRIGGISPPPFDSLNLGNPNGCPVQDDYDRIWANYARLLSCINCDSQPPLRVHQVHGNVVARVERGAKFDTACKADALISRDSERVISIRIADCVPILISSADGRLVAAVHAGWRGIVAGVIAETVKRMLNDGTGPADTFIAAIGPCIGHDSFEVGTEVLEEFTRLFGAAAPISRHSQTKGKVDLRKTAMMQLMNCGIPERNIDSTDRCTFSHREEFFSHRRDNGTTGRLAAVIAPNSP